MSSTARGYDRHASDYYVTPVHKIEEFIHEIVKIEPTILDGIILDPCAGGLVGKDEMSYPKAINSIFPNIKVNTMDIREDSLAEVKGDYLHTELSYKPNLIITNPPFVLAREVVEKAMEDIEDGGFVVMLQRLNFFGSDKRKGLWDKYMPKYTIVHRKRMSFTDNGKTDSIEYAHFVWQKGHLPEFSQLKVI